MINQRQVFRLVTEFNRTKCIIMSALKAGMDRKTARKYLDHPDGPSLPRPQRDWRTRMDPLGDIWPEAESYLRVAPELEAKALFEHLLDKGGGGQIQEEHLRTFQRRVRQWRLEHGPEPEVFFPQQHIPGEVMQLDWTHAKELKVNIGDKPLDHLLCQAVLPYSNWQWATRCQSESLLSLKHGLQEALFRLGKVPKQLQIDNSSAATHQISAGGKREFNSEFLGLVGHYGLLPRTIQVGCPNENGDVEAHNGHLKRRMEQHLLLRGSRQFGCETEYDQFLIVVLARANGLRTAKISEELAVMRDLPPTRLCQYEEIDCRVCSYSTIRVKQVPYSVPSRYIRHRLRVHLYEQRLELYHGNQLIGEIARLRGRRPVIDYRHVIEGLLRKPGAFARYRYREELFLSLTYRRAFDHLVAEHGVRPGELEYLRLLKLSAELGAPAVEACLDQLLAGGTKGWRAADLRRTLCPLPQPPLEEKPIDLSVYDALLTEEVCHVA